MEALIAARAVAGMGGGGFVLVFLDILHGKVDRMFFRMMTGDHSIYPGTLLFADKPTAQFRAWLLQT
jgi:hypothetical protein